MQSQAADVGHQRQPVGERAQPRVAEGQRIAAAEYHLFDARIRRESIERLLQWTVADLFLVRKFTPKAVPAMDRAGPGDDQQRAAGVFLQQSGSLEGVALSQRIGP